MCMYVPGFLVVHVEVLPVIYPVLNVNKCKFEKSFQLGTPSGSGL